MGIVYNIICILLATTICGIATDNVTAQGDNKPIDRGATDVNTAVPPVTSTIPATVTVKASTVANTNVSTNSPVLTNATDTRTVANITDTVNNNATVNDNATVANTIANSTVIIHPPTVPTTASTKTTITETSEKPTTKPTTKPTITVAPSDSVVYTTTPPTVTNSIPPVSSPSKNRHFDGLSFLGGIILVICLMAVGAFSWKFYRTYDQQNYRTL